MQSISYSAVPTYEMDGMHKHKHIRWWCLERWQRHFCFSLNDLLTLSFHEFWLWLHSFHSNQMVTCASLQNAYCQITKAIHMHILWLLWRLKVHCSRSESHYSSAVCVCVCFEREGERERARELSVLHTQMYVICSRHSVSFTQIVCQSGR